MMDTKTFMSKDDYGNSLSIGFSSLMRNGKREKVNFFNANGILLQDLLQLLMILQSLLGGK